jgi:carbamoyl-phosphate synthase small subunit
MEQIPGILALEDVKGSKPIIFRGELFGWIGKPDGDRGQGEVVFNTGMSGYQEILTDPSYHCQIICMTAPHIGNVGINSEDFESKKIYASGFVCAEVSRRASNWRSQKTLSDFLLEHKIPGIHRVDTRAITLELRNRGSTRGWILPENHLGDLNQLMRNLPPLDGRDLISEVTTREPYRFGRFEGKYHIVAIDYGVKTNLLRSLENRGCKVTVVPASISAAEVLSFKPDGIFLSNGPGDPSVLKAAHETVRNLIGKRPIFGVCMGHQILAIAIGSKTYKLKFGHRGSNQPVYDYTMDRVEISSHNHGYSVDESTLPAEAIVTHRNLNDNTVEGIALPKYKAFSVQYHPEAAPGPHDSSALFDRFIQSL